MCMHYKKRVHELSLPEHGWHFVASRARPIQVQDFRVEDMATEMQTRAPDLWSLLQALLVVVMCILMNNHDQRCNALQSTIGIFLHASGTPDRVIKVMSRMGVSISLPSIHRAVKSLSEETCEELCDLGQSLLASYAYDNFEFLLPTGIPTVDKPGEGLVHLTSGTLLRLEHGVTLDDLRCSNLVWNRSEFNPKASDPRPFNPYKIMHQLRDPEFVEAIPIRKLKHVPLRTMDLNQSKISGNIAAIQDMFKQAGIGDSRQEHIAGGRLDMGDIMTIVNGDLGTYERLLSARRRRSIEDTAYDRLQSVAFSEGFFHFKMAGADALWRVLMSSPKSRADEMSFAGLVGKLRPRDSSRLIANAKFRQQHELIGHVSVVLQLDAWRVEVQKRYPRFKSLEEWAASKPAMGDIAEIADHLVREYVEGEGLDFFELECRPKAARDQVRENTMRLQNYLLLYEELCYAMNAGDIGCLETLIVPWVRMFRATGKHKYGNHTLRFMHDLYFVYPDGLRRAIRLNILVNPTGKPLEFRAVDWVVELLNLYTKFTYGGEGSNYTKARIILESVLVLVYRSSLANLERNFALSGLSHAHAAKDMRETFKVVLDFIRGQKANEFKGGRTVNHSIPDIIMQGGEIIENEEPGKGVGLGQSVEVVEGETELHLGVDGAEIELTAEDLSTEGILF
ncbi:hypothetical protein LXA43DRAFT_881670 [Ganoderma leucocontextum]|nr:hypothetical protein LXA43DRAFT_908186 [Ganoderma leucocontextum]KAI1795742.1 hypothetical protein LXA43DRAFT_881670 [Ganoderma leucocontextum]